MPRPKYIDLDDAVERVRDLVGLEAGEIGEETVLRNIEELLNLSSAKVEVDNPIFGEADEPKKITEEHFRPYYVAAKKTLQDVDIQFLTKADQGEEFTRLIPSVHDWLLTQLSYDKEYNLELEPTLRAEFLISHYRLGKFTRASVAVV